MHKCDLINSSHLKCSASKGMQALDENSEVFFNFINTLHSESTKKSYRFCLEKFLNHYGIDLLSFLKLPVQDISNLIIKYLVDVKVSRQYKSLITTTLKRACEIELGNEYSIYKIPVSLYTIKSVGIDPRFSSSGTGIVVLENIKPDNMKDTIRVIESHLIEKGDPNGIVNLCWDIWKRRNWMNTYFS